MKKISYYLVFAVIIGGLLSSFWVYRKYFYEESDGYLYFKVERGPVREIVRVRGDAAADKEFNLEFPFSGIVSGIFVREGQVAERGDFLMKLDSADYDFQLGRLEALLAQRRSGLEKLKAGPTEEDVNVLKTKVSGAKTAMGEAKKGVVDKLKDALTKSDDAVRGKADGFFSNPRSSNPTLDFELSDFSLKTELEEGRFSVEGVLNSWQASLSGLSSSEDLDSRMAEAKENLGLIRSFLDEVALAVNSLKTKSGLSQTTIDAWKADIYSARTNVNTAATSLLAAEEKRRAAESKLALAERELALKTAGARQEDIEIAEARVSETENQISEAREKIKKSKLYAPVSAEVVKIPLEEGELFAPGTPAIYLSSSRLKIIADISELDIRKLNGADGNEVSIKFDAFPDTVFWGRTTRIDPKEIIKDGDTYYRVNVYFGENGKKVRPGMSADLEILISSKDDVLKIPEIAVYEKGGKKFVKLFEDGSVSEQEVETGISDGEFVEITEGLSEGQTAVVSAD